MNVRRHYWRNWKTKGRSADSLKDGIETGDFREMPIPETVNILIAFINGLVRQQVYKLDNLCGLWEAAVSFCRFNLVNP